MPVIVLLTASVRDMTANLKQHDGVGQLSGHWLEWRLEVMHSATWLTLRKHNTSPS
jgi:hypothetical protein